MNFFRLLTCLLYCFGLAVLAAPTQAQVFNPQTFTLDNGLHVIVVENHRAPVVNHTIIYHVGAKDEPVGKSGLAHFMEHLMFKGTQKIPAGEFSQIVRSIGGQNNAYTTQDYTAYFQSVAREHLPLMMEMEVDRMTNLTLTDEIVAIERDVILKERGQRTDNNPVGAFWEDVSNILFVNHAYATPIIGWRHEIESLTKDDIEAFYHQWYAPNNATVILSGAINLREAQNLAREYYAPIAKKLIPERLETKIPNLTGKRRLVKKSTRVSQPLWSRHYHAPQARIATIKDSDALLFFADIFGGGATGQLYQSLVVDQKIAVNAFVSYTPQFIGPARFSIIITPADGVSLDQIERAVNQEITRFLTTTLDKQKISDTAKSLKIQSIYARDTLSGPSHIIGGALGAGLDLKTIEAWPQRVDSITAEEVTEAAKKLFDTEKFFVTGIMLPAGETP